MLLIRAEQLKVFQVSQLQRFEDTMASHLKRRFAGRAAVEDEARLRAMIREGRELARQFGVVHGPDVRIFLELTAELGPDFHLLPWAAKILSDTTLSGAGKIESLDRYSLFALRR
jgi:hypothetical protein